MKRFILLIWLLAAFINSDLLSQSKEENKNNFIDAESWIIYEAYNDALPIYLQLLKVYPGNANFKYRIGQCYINTPGEKTKAISYLEDAVKNINPNYKEGKFTETGAPYDALYYLANAYRINNQLDKALKIYQQFKQNLNPAVYDSAIVNLQILSCNNAKELMNKPVYVRLKNLGNTINSDANDFNPVISDKEDLLVFSRSMAFYDAILYSTKTNGKWSEPKNLNEVVKIDRDLFPTSISKDGKTIYLYSSADYDGIIYSIRFENGTWSSVIKLNENINTKYWESHATISHDNKKLYFTSNRKGTSGGLDIYVSKRDSSGDWGPAVNLGSKINTPYNEESPFLTEDDKTLFFSSRGHFNMGGYDIFYSKLQDNGDWSTPINVGYPLNTTDDDVFFKPIHMGSEGYTSKDIPGGMGHQDIYHVEIFSDNHPREFQLPQGGYQITNEVDGGTTVTSKLELPQLNPSDSIVVPETILPKSGFATDLNVPTEKNLNVLEGDSTKKNVITSKIQSDADNVNTQLAEADRNQVDSPKDSSIAISSSDIAAIDNKTVSITHNNLLLICALSTLGILFLLFLLWQIKRKNKE